MLAKPGARRSARSCNLLQPQVRVAQWALMPAPLNIAGKLRTLCIGTWAWSPSPTWGKEPGTNTDEATNHEAFKAAIDAGITFFDTAEHYGESEERIGRYLSALSAEERSKVAIASKFLPLPYHFSSSNVVSHLKASLAKMGLERLDLYQIHGPSVSIRSVETWAHGLADALDQGLCAQVGVSNYNSDQVARTVKVLKERGHRLASNQIEFSLLKRRPETSGLLQKCADMGVAVMAYSPLAMGRLTGKSFKGAETKERVFASGGYSSEQYDALIGKLRQVGEAHGGATPAQIALAWTIAKGTVPIAGAKTAKQARENAAAATIILSGDEVAALDALSVDGQRSGLVPGWQTSKLDEL